MSTKFYLRMSASPPVVSVLKQDPIGEPSHIRDGCVFLDNLITAPVGVLLFSAEASLPSAENGGKHLQLLNSTLRTNNTTNWR